jgi:hypothetical protein
MPCHAMPCHAVPCSILDVFEISDQPWVNAQVYDYVDKKRTVEHISTVRNLSKNPRQLPLLEHQHQPG